MVYPGSEEIKATLSELSAVQVVNGIREKLIEDGVQCEQCPLLSEWDENKVINQLIKDYRLIRNRDYELNVFMWRPRLMLNRKLERAEVFDSAKEYEVLYEAININGKEVTGKLNVVAVSRFDAVFIMVASR